MDDPSLGAFVLTWDDLVGLPRSPDTVVSIACSSGRTVVGSGGARLGLETGLLANSTRFLVAPLWNVEQRSAVRWVRAYTAASAASEDPPRAHRLATLQLMDRHPHPYHWAPYAMSTALRGAPS